jgi:hypothetical protein
MTARKKDRHMKIDPEQLEAHTAFRQSILLLARGELGTITSAELREQLGELVPIMQADLEPKPEPVSQPAY